MIHKMVFDIAVVRGGVRKLCREFGIAKSTFYYWKKRQEIPNLLARLLYVGATYQELLEFDVPFDQSLIDRMKEQWKYICRQWMK